MRWRFWSRPRFVPEPDLEELPHGHPAEGVALGSLESPHAFRVGAVQVLRGWLRYDSPETRARLEADLTPLDVTWFYEGVDGRTRVTVTHPAPPKVPPEWPWNLAGLVLTAISTLVAGAYLEGAPLAFPLREPGRIAEGVPFAATLLGILAAHEFGHWFAARRYGLDVTLPFFIPLPLLSPIGTLGAVIKMKTPIYTRRMLLDVGAAGPLAGLVVAIPVTIWGVAHSPVLPTQPGAGILLGEPLLFQVIVALFGPTVPEGQDLYLGNVAFSGWIGLLVTALNMLPVGQLDGGHVVYALLGRKQHAIGWAVFVAILVLGWWWQGWFVWGVLILFLIRVRHPPVLDPHLELDPARKAAGWLAVAAFVLCFAPVPFDL
jgi:membrane-associated protease RseP (regulator of RpoE activity)